MAHQASVAEHHHWTSAVRVLVANRQAIDAGEEHARAHTPSYLPCPTSPTADPSDNNRHPTPNTALRTRPIMSDSATGQEASLGSEFHGLGVVIGRSATSATSSSPISGAGHGALEGSHLLAMFGYLDTRTSATTAKGPPGPTYLHGREP